MSTTKQISIYQINKYYFIVPTWNDNGGCLGIHPIRKLSIECSLIELGQNILLSKSDCKQGDTDYSQNSFKELLKISKVRSERKLVKNSKHAILKFHEDRIVYELLRPDNSGKYFVGKPEDVFESNSNVNPEELATHTINVLNDKFEKRILDSDLTQIK